MTTPATRSARPAAAPPPLRAPPWASRAPYTGALPLAGVAASAFPRAATVRLARRGRYRVPGGTYWVLVRADGRALADTSGAELRFACKADARRAAAARSLRLEAVP